MSSDQRREEKKEISLELESSKVTSTRINEQCSKGRKNQATSHQLKTSPRQTSSKSPSCHCAPASKNGGEADPIKGNRYSFCVKFLKSYNKIVPLKLWLATGNTYKYFVIAFVSEYHL